MNNWFSTIYIYIVGLLPINHFFMFNVDVNFCDRYEAT